MRQRVGELERFKAEHRPSELMLPLVDKTGRYRAIFESASEVVLVVDRKGKIVDVNGRLTELGGYEREELVGKNIRSLAKIMTKESLAVIIANSLKTMAGANVPPYEVEMFKKNGGLATLEINARALRNDGKIVGGIAILTDITERKRAEEEFWKTDTRLRVLQQAMVAVHSTLDLEKVFKQVTDGAVYSLGYTSAFILTLNHDKKCFEVRALSSKKPLMSKVAKILGFPLGKLSVSVDSVSKAGVRSALEGKLIVSKSLTEIVCPIISRNRCSALEKLAGTKNYIVMPLTAKGQVVGVVMMTSCSGGSYRRRAKPDSRFCRCCVSSHC